MNVFEFCNSVSHNKKNLLEEDPYLEKAYVPFVVNRQLSYFPDTIMYAQEMNRAHHLDGKMQYDYLLHTIRPRKRFSKWAKKAESEDVEAIKKYFNFSNEKAQQTLKVLTSEQLLEIKEKLNEGG